MGTFSTVLLAIHLAATAAMVGLIWFVQLVHYPLFASVGEPGFTYYEADHQRRTARVVGPLMGLEALTALILVIAPPDGLGRTLPVTCLLLLVVVQLSTVGVQVPIHSALADRYDLDHVERLVRSNWIRTLGWTARGILAVAMVVVAAR